ncbi:MAG: hypothetical protein ABIR91_05640 [Candidatus Saccharimonadales bacterium]
MQLLRPRKNENIHQVVQQVYEQLNLFHRNNIEQPQNDYPLCAIYPAEPSLWYAFRPKSSLHQIAPIAYRKIFIKKPDSEIYWSPDRGVYVRPSNLQITDSILDPYVWMNKRGKLIIKWSPQPPVENRSILKFVSRRELYLFAPDELHRLVYYLTIMVNHPKTDESVNAQRKLREMDQQAFEAVRSQSG